MLSRWSLLVLGLVAVAGAAAACEGLSPGDLLDMGDHTCTLGFVVADPNGIYFSTAGHCVQNGDVAATPDVGEWGVGVFHFLEPETGSTSDGSPGYDFALIEVDPAFYEQVNPKMCGYDGPTGIYDEAPGDGGVLTYGHGLVWGDLGAFGLPTYARPGTMLLNDGDAFYWYGVNTPGDSGGAVLADDGRALGVVTHLRVAPDGTNGGTHLERGFKLAAEEGFTDLRLVLMGEDPVEVLRELQNEAPTAQPPATNGTAAKPNASSGNVTPPSSKDPGARNATGAGANDSIEPAAADPGTVEGATTNKTPFAPWPLVTLAIALALALRKK